MKDRRALAVLAGVAMLALVACRTAPGPSRDLGNDLSLGGCNMSPLDPSSQPSCCPGACEQDGCCDPICYGPLVGGACRPGMTCDYDVPGAQGVFTCDASGHFPICLGTCVDLAAVD
jgi:hypothetical protein